jgi:hypothetical protein
MTPDDVIVKQDPPFVNTGDWKDMVSMRRKFNEPNMWIDIAEPYVVVYGNGFVVSFELKDKLGKYSFGELIGFVMTEIEERLIYRSEFGLL